MAMRPHRMLVLPCLGACLLVGLVAWLVSSVHAAPPYRAPQSPKPRAAVPAANPKDAAPMLAPAPAPAEQGPPELPPDAPGAVQDPTQAQGELRELLAGQQVGKQTAAPPPPAIPLISLRGVVKGPLGSPSIILSVGDERTINVRPHREYLLGGGARVTSLKVIGIGADGVEVEILPSGQRMILP